MINGKVDWLKVVLRIAFNREECVSNFHRLNAIDQAVKRLELQLTPIAAGSFSIVISQ